MITLKDEDYRRSDLFALVWQHAMSDIGAACKVSDVLMHKFCKAWGIPRPTKAQRGKLRTGSRVSLPELPPREEGDPVLLKSVEGSFRLQWPPIKPRPVQNKKDGLDELIEQIKSGKCKRKRRPRVDPEPIDVYIYKIGRWSPAVHFGPSESTAISLNCEMIAPRKSRGREANIELKFVSYLTTDEDRQKAGVCVNSGATVVLIVPAAMAASTIEILCAGRFRYLKVTYRPAAASRAEDVESFHLVGDLEDGDLE